MGATNDSGIVDEGDFHRFWNYFALTNRSGTGFMVRKRLKIIVTCFVWRILAKNNIIHHASGAKIAVVSRLHRNSVGNK